MKTILVDAWNTFVTSEGVNTAMKELLDSYPNRKIILTNANDEQMITFGLIDMPYELFTLKHEPDKVDPKYYTTVLKQFGLALDEVVYFEHNTDAVVSARSIGITTHHYDKDVRDIAGLKTFLDSHL